MIHVTHSDRHIWCTKKPETREGRSLNTSAVTVGRAKMSTLRLGTFRKRKVARARRSAFVQKMMVSATKTRGNSLWEAQRVKKPEQCEAEMP